MKRTHIEVKQSKADGQWYWHGCAKNGKVICQGEGHPTRAKAIRAAQGVVRAVIGPERLFDLLTFTRSEHKGAVRIEW